MKTAILLFTRDLRVHDHPALSTAAQEADRVVPLFVLDEHILGSGYAAPNRLGFLLESLHDLDGSLRGLGARLVVRRGDPATEVARLVSATGAGAVYVSSDVSAYAQRRERQLREAVSLRTMPGLTVVPADALAPSSGDHYRIFSPYWRAWQRTQFRDLEAPPAWLRLPEQLDPGQLPQLAELVDGERSPEPMARGGEREGRARMDRWLGGELARYANDRGGLRQDGTSRLSPYLHFGCISPLELVRGAEGRAGGEAYVRQLCWRDFYHQLLLWNQETPREELHPRGDHPRPDAEALAAWKDGLTGYPIVDAGMRQLAREGWMHNRARLIVASFLVKHLLVDWRLGAAHFFRLLLDGNVASNVGNWQWVAGTGVDTRPYRVYNPTLQAQRHDPDGDYVRRYVPELAELGADEIHEPWKLPAARRSGIDYPEPIVEHRAAVQRFREQREGSGRQLELDLP